jgi:hypothetical protein
LGQAGTSAAHPTRHDVAANSYSFPDVDAVRAAPHFLPCQPQHVVGGCSKSTPHVRPPCQCRLQDFSAAHFSGGLPRWRSIAGYPPPPPRGSPPTNVAARQAAFVRFRPPASPPAREVPPLRGAIAMLRCCCAATPPSAACLG